MRNLFRYPGGKARLLSQIMPHLSSWESYLEPFVGAGSVLLSVLESGQVRRAWVNDYDRGIYAIWQCIKDDPEGLCARLLELSPSVDAYKKLGEPTNDLLTEASRRIAWHQWSFSGIGPKSGAPIGGWGQEGKYKIGCRWNPGSLVKRIRRAADLVSRVDIRITNMDALSILAGPDPYCSYIDPPYVKEGDRLYKCGMPLRDHLALRRILGGRRQPWLLSYDDCVDVNMMYRGLRIERISATYTASKKARTVELLISNAPGGNDEKVAGTKTI